MEEFVNTVFKQSEQCWDMDPGKEDMRTMRFVSTARVLPKCKLKYYRISECMRTYDAKAPVPQSVSPCHKRLPANDAR